MSVYECFDHILPHTSLLRENKIYCGKISRDFVCAKEKEDGVYGIWNGFSNFIWAENIHWN